jgi:hypothetical protein
MDYKQSEFEDAVKKVNKRGGGYSNDYTKGPFSVASDGMRLTMFYKYAGDITYIGTFKDDGSMHFINDHESESIQNGDYFPYGIFVNGKLIPIEELEL